MKKSKGAPILACLIITMSIFILYVTNIIYRIVVMEDLNSIINELANEILIIFNWGLLSTALSYILIKKIITTKILALYFSVFGGAHIVMSILLPRFSSYYSTPKIIELFVIKNIALVDGEMFLIGVMLIIMSYIANKCIVLSTDFS